MSPQKYSAIRSVYRHSRTEKRISESRQQDLSVIDPVRLNTACRVCTQGAGTAKNDQLLKLGVYLKLFLMISNVVLKYG
mgnify:CR=1 FL=1